MDFTNDGVRLAISFVVPGLIVFFVRAQFLSGRMAHTENVLSYLALSSIYYALTLPIMMLLVDDSTNKDPLWVAGWFCFLFLGPAVFGLILGISVQKGWSRSLLAMCGLNLVHALPTSWDFLFSRTTGFSVIVKLVDGSEVAGFFHKKSFASSVATDRDLYLEESFGYVDGQWVSTDKRGIYISAKEIRTIEIWG
jgi:hypothetical protein